MKVQVKYIKHKMETWVFTSIAKVDVIDITIINGLISKDKSLNSKYQILVFLLNVNDHLRFTIAQKYI